MDLARRLLARGKRVSAGRASAVALTLLLAAGADTTMGQAPGVVAPPRYKNAPSNIAGRSAVSAGEGDAWWRVFHDAALDALEQQAAESNQDLRQTVARIDQARQGARRAAADLYPQVNSDLTANRQRTTNTGPIGRAAIVGNASAFTGLFGGGGNTVPVPASGSLPAFTSQPLSVTINDFRVPLTVSYEIDVFGRLRHTLNSAKADAQAAEADRRAVALGLSAEVAVAYFEVRALDSENAVLRRTLAGRQDAVRLAQERVNAGVAGPLDLARARVELDNTQADYQETLRQRAELENNLAALCGQSASSFHVAVRPLDRSAPPAIPPGVPMQLLARRPDLAEAERRVASAAEQIGAAKAQFLPTFNIQGSAGLESGSDNQLFEAQSRELSVLGTIHIPIFEGGRNLADLRAARARRDEAEAGYRSTAITAFKEVETALSDLQLRATQAEARQRAVADAGQVLDLSQKRYLEGATNYLDVVDAQRLQLGAEISAVQTLDGRYTATISLVRAIGGSWVSAAEQK
jgi:multidrug efflux system outer membrane protein